MKKYSYKRSKLNSQISNHVKKLKKWKYKNLFLFLLSILIAYLMLKNEASFSFFKELHYLGYLSAFLAGLMFTSSLTVAPATALIYTLGSMFNPFLIAVIGAFSAVFGDYVIYRVVRDKLIDEIKLLYEEVKNFLEPITKPIIPKDLKLELLLWEKVAHSKLRWFVPVIAGFIIASPLPDEIGVALLGAAKFEIKRFFALSYLLNFVGILAIGTLGSL